MGFIGIDHIAVGVTDLETSEATWCDVFGATVQKRAVSEGLGAHQVFLAFAEGTTIELFAPTADDTPSAALLAASGEGFQALSMLVDDLDEAVAELEANGVRTFRRGGSVFVDRGSTNGLIMSLSTRD